MSAVRILEYVFSPGLRVYMSFALRMPASLVMFKVLPDLWRLNKMDLIVCYLGNSIEYPLSVEVSLFSNQNSPAKN